HLARAFDSPAARLALSVGYVPFHHVGGTPLTSHERLAAILDAAQIEQQHIRMLHSVASLVEARVDAAKRAFPLSKGGQSADVLVRELVERLAANFHMATGI